MAVFDTVNSLMKRAEVEQFKRDLIEAFGRRTVGTTSLEIMRLLDRFEPDIRAKLRDEWIECANPEPFLHPDARDDFEFANAGSVAQLLLCLAEHHPSFAITDEQWSQLRDIDDRAEARGETRTFTLPYSPEDYS